VTTQENGRITRVQVWKWYRHAPRARSVPLLDVRLGGLVRVRLLDSRYSYVDPRPRTVRFLYTHGLDATGLRNVYPYDRFEVPR
jgi:hypothetical protein